MSHSRPASVAVLCFFIIVNAMLTLMIALMNSSAGGDLEYGKWLENHRDAANALVTFAYLHAGLSMCAAYFMLKAKNWARWLYLIECAAYLGALFWALATGHLYSATGLSRNSLLLVVAIVILFRKPARQHFHAHSRAWWRYDG